MKARREPEGPAVYTVAEAGKYLRQSAPKVRQLVAAGELQAAAIPGGRSGRVRLLFTQAMLDEFLERHKTALNWERLREAAPPAPGWWQAHLERVETRKQRAAERAARREAS